MTLEIIALTLLSSSFLGLVKCTMMDLSEGQTYTTSICYPLQDCVKIKRYSPEMVGENGSYSSFVLAVCHSWTWHLFSVRIGLGNLHFVTLPPWFWEICLPLIRLPILSIWPLILFDSNAVKFQNHFGNMFKSKSFYILYIPWSFVSVLINTHIKFFVLCRWCGIHYDPPSLDRFMSTSAHYLGSWSRDSFLVP